MTLRSRLLAGSLLLIGLLGAAGAYQLRLVGQVQRQNRALASVGLEVSQSTVRMARDLATIREFTRKFDLLVDPGYAQELRRLRSEVANELTTLAQLDLSEPERRVLDRLVDSWSRATVAAERFEAAVLAGDDAADPGALTRLYAGFDGLLEELEIRSREATERRIASGEVAARRVRTIAVSSLLLAIVGASILSLALARWVSEPVRRLAAATGRLADGDFGVRAPPGGSAEIVSLAHHFNSMAERLGEVDRLKRDFVVAVSHDLKSPLAAMQESVRFLLESGELTATQKEMLELNLETARRLSSMIGELLEAGRLEAGSSAFDLGREELAEIAREALLEARDLLSERVLETRFPPYAVPIRADRPLLVRAVWNLLSNAAAVVPAQGRIGLIIGRLESTEELRAAFERQPADSPTPAARLEVWDTGPGIPDAHKETIFEPFRRLPGDERRSGTGVGLAIVARVVAGHGGRVWVEDRSGGGSRFVVLLPLAGGETGDHEKP